MEEFGFTIDGLLSEEEAEKMFGDSPDDNRAEPDGGKPEDTADKNDEPAEEKPEGKAAPEKVGEEEIESPEDNADDRKERGASPSVFSSIAKALKEDGIFPDFTNDEIDAVNTADDFAELFEKAVEARLDDRQKRISSALDNGVQPDAVRQHEQTIGYLNSITDEAIADEGENGENLRRQLIFNDLINRGYSQERANREVEKSFKSASDIEDAKDALEGLKDFYGKSYQKLLDDSKAAADAAKKRQKDDAEKFRKMILEEELSIGDVKLDKRNRQKVYDSVMKPIWKDPDTGALLTEVQKFSKEHPLEFMKQLGLWFTLTEGGKNIDALVGKKVRAEKNRSIRELEGKINSTSFNPDGTLNYSGGDGNEPEDLLLSDNWKVG